MLNKDRITDEIDDVKTAMLDLEVFVNEKKLEPLDDGIDSGSPCSAGYR